MKKEEFKTGINAVTVYPAGTGTQTVVYCCEFSDSGEELLSACAERECPQFDLVTVHIPDWDKALSPWPLRSPAIPEDVSREMGKAPETMRRMEEEIIPEAERILGYGSARRILCGYSMAGLFAASAPFLSYCFDAVVSASGVLWYPGFPGFFRSHPFLRTPSSVYLSVGDSESPERNGFFENVLGDIRDECIARGARSVLEINSGDHLADPCARLAKGIVWTLREGIR